MMNKRINSVLTTFPLAFCPNFGWPRPLAGHVGPSTPQAPEEAAWGSYKATGGFTLAHQRAPASSSPSLYSLMWEEGDCFQAWLPHSTLVPGRSTSAKSSWRG